MKNDEIKEALDDFLRAEAIVRAVNENLPDAVPKLEPLPKDYVFKALDREAPGKALMACFEALGGVPALIQWAMADQKNMGRVYDHFFKQIPTEQHIEHSGGLVVQGSLGDSDLDDFDGDLTATRMVQGVSGALNGRSDH